jgi:hypothetical protein
MRKGRTALLAATAALACAPVMALAQEPATLPILLPPVISAPPDEPPSALAVPMGDAAPLPGDRPVLAPASGFEVLEASVFATPAPPPVSRVLSVAAAKPPRPRPTPGQALPARSSTVRATRPPASAAPTTPRRESTPARTAPGTETTRRIQPGWLLGVYR